MKKIAVIGSINTDFAFRCKSLPKPSETVIGDSFEVNFGGKGANEAVAIARLGGQPMLFGMVGEDLYSYENLKNLQKENVNVNYVEKAKACTGGTAGIMIGDETNSIIVVGGANMKVDEEYLLKHQKDLLVNDIFCLQLELPIKTIEQLVEMLYQNNKTIIFNPSPIAKINESIYNKCSFIIVNETEIMHLPDFESNEQMLKKYNGRLILTYGANGVYYYNNGIKHIDALKIKDIKDTTGAGDTFLGAFAVAISKDKSIDEAVNFANCCAGLKTTKNGAQIGMPYLEEINIYLNQK